MEKKFNFLKINKLSYIYLLITYYSNMKIIINGTIKEFNVQSMTAAELVIQLKLEGKRFAIECNGEIMPRSLFNEFMINDGDQLEIVGAVGGG